MNHCKTCKHWAPEGSDFGDMRGAGECNNTPAMHLVTDYHPDPLDETNQYKALRPEHAAVLAMVEDGSAYYARLVTMPDFGCVQHETITTTTAPPDPQP